MYMTNNTNFRKVMMKAAANLTMWCLNNDMDALGVYFFFNTCPHTGRTELCVSIGLEFEAEVYMVHVSDTEEEAIEWLANGRKSSRVIHDVIANELKLDEVEGHEELREISVSEGIDELVAEFISDYVECVIVKTNARTSIIHSILNDTQNVNSYVTEVKKDVEWMEVYKSPNTSTNTEIVKSSEVM